MWVNLLLILIIISSITILIVDNKEQYSLLGDIGEKRSPGRIDQSRSIKYVDHRYYNQRQRRAKGQDRDTGENR